METWTKTYGPWRFNFDPYPNVLFFRAVSAQDRLRKQRCVPRVPPQRYLTFGEPLEQKMVGDELAELGLPYESPKTHSLLAILGGSTWFHWVL